MVVLKPIHTCFLSRNILDRLFTQSQVFASRAHLQYSASQDGECHNPRVYLAMYNLQHSITFQYPNGLFNVKGVIYRILREFLDWPPINPLVQMQVPEKQNMPYGIPQLLLMPPTILIPLPGVFLIPYTLVYPYLVPHRLYMYHLQT